jgi:glycosyltransferase involved in cell wall biosynthesis
MELSFVVCTRDRAQLLPRSLDSIAAALAQKPELPAELVVVDNGSTDGTPQLVHRFRTQKPFPVRLVEERRPGLARARNAGIAAARGRLVAFIDDDCALVPSYLDDLLRHAAADAAPVLRGGRVSLGDPADLHFTVKEWPHSHRMARETHPALVVLGCNMVIPRAILDAVGRFDERLGAGTPLHAAEDADYAYRAFRAGFAVEYVPDMAVLHFHGRRDPAEVQELERRYNFGNGALAAKWMFRDLRMARGLLWMLRRSLDPAWRRKPVWPNGPATWGQVLDANLAGALAWLRLRRGPPGASPAGPPS